MNERGKICRRSTSNHLQPAHRFIPLGIIVLLASAYILTGCNSQAGSEPSRSVPDGDADVGAELIRTHGCNNCHTIPGIRGADGTVGPPLTDFARRTYIAGAVPNKTNNLLIWIQDPQQIEPGTAMPSLRISEAEARHIAAYLYTLQ